MPRNRIRHQTRIRGERRDQLPSCVLKSIRNAVEKEASRYNVSKSFVVAVILAKAFGISDQELY